MTSTNSTNAVDIDDIWNSMKASSNLTSLKEANKLTSLWEAPSSKKKQLMKGDVDDERQTSTTISAVSNNHDQSRECNKFETSSKSKQIALVIPKEVPTPSLALTEDSDDETDDEDESELLNKGDDVEKEILRLERCASLLKSECLTDRLGTLEKLHKTIGSLSANCEKIQPLNLPPPYDSSRITLTHRQHGLVSDLAKAEHVVDWGPWERTQVPLLAQFENDDPDNQEEHINYRDNASKPLHQSELFDQLQSILNACGTAIFILFSDKSETCRSLAISCVQMLTNCGIDMGRHIPYLLPAIFSRYPPQAYDHEMQLFVDKIDDHELYKRGRCCNETRSN